MSEKNNNALHVQFEVEVAYATPSKQTILTVCAQLNDTVQTVIERSGILQKFPEIDMNQQKIGIFSKPCNLTTLVQPGDRVEIYRPLTIDPKEARRLRERKMLRIKNQK